MTDQTNQPAPDAIHWWQSETIWSTLISIVAGGAALGGHTIDAGTQAHLVTALSDVANGVAVIAAACATYYRMQATAPIKPILKKPDTPPA